MLESFWIPLSPHQQQQRHGENASAATVPVASSMNSSKLLTSIQDDFTSRYGEIMGRRKLQSCLLSATTTPTTNDNDNNNNNNKPLVGIIAMDMTLVDETNEIQYTRLEAEQTLTKAISSLGPKERREYSRKDCTVHEIVSGLLPNLKVAVVLSNLAVCQSQRQKGIGMELCNYVHDFAKTTWGMEYVYLRVEADNTAARKLYEEKLGYQCCWVEKDAIALRADVMTGEFQEMEKDTWSLCKQL
jgi:GNAT superfamily N-acetyltransferase